MPFLQPPLMAGRTIDCVEIYLPKSIEFLSEIYQLLRDKVKNRLGGVVLDGFSIYEADGVFHGEVLWEQRTLVIRPSSRSQSGDAGQLARRDHFPDGPRNCDQGCRSRGADLDLP
jgi:hypothetical protein